MTYQRAAEIFATAKNPNTGKPIGNNTRLLKIGAAFFIRLHNTDVVTINVDGTYRLHAGGWRTLTTKARINCYSPARLYSKRGGWYLRCGHPFHDGILIDSEGRPVLESRPIV